MKRNLLKTMLLAAVALTAGNSAWADTYKILYGTASYDTDGTTVLSVAPQADFSGDANEKTGVPFSDANGNSQQMPIGGSVLYANTSSSWTKDFSLSVTSGKVYFAGNYTVSANNTQTFRIVDSKGTAIFASTSSATSGKNGTYVVATICGTEISNYVRQPRSCAYGIKSLCIDLDARTVAYDLLVSSGNSSYTELKDTLNLPEDVTNVNGLSVQKTSYGCYLDSVMLYSQVSDEAKYEYTVNYTLDETTVKSVSANVVAGTEITSEAIVYDADGAKYFAKDEKQTLTVTADRANTLNVAVRKAYSATLNLTTTIGKTSTDTTATFIEADDNTCSWSYVYPLYVRQDGQYYKADNTDTFGESGTFTNGETISKTVAYTNADEDVVFFAEGESAKANDGVDYQYSNGATGYINAQNHRNSGISVGTLDAGTYEMETYVTGNEKRCVAVRNCTSEDTAVDTLAQVNATGVQTVQFVLSASTPLVINGKSVVQNNSNKTNQSADFDYVLIKKAETVEVTVGTDSYATYCPSKALDFTNASSIKAYKASVSGKTVTLTQVETVAAGEGVLLYAEGGATESIVVASGTVTKADDNAFVGVTEATTLSETDDNGNTNFVLSKESEVVGFFKANNTSIAAGKAYLPVTLTSEAKSLTMVFDGETTGINEVKAVNVESGAYYNLSGQRVSQPTKGLYIVNGKKVIVK